MTYRFTWDPAKAKSNVRKHGIWFEDAVQVFADPFREMRLDRIEGGEERWQTVGVVNGITVLLVAHTMVSLDDGIDLVRIISARRAEPRERRRYEDSHG